MLEALRATSHWHEQGSKLLSSVAVAEMSYSLNSLKGCYEAGLYRGLLQRLLRGMLGVETIAHMLYEELLFG